MKKLIILVTISTIILTGCSSTVTDFVSSYINQDNTYNVAPPKENVYGPGEYVVGRDIPVGNYSLYILEGLESAKYTITNKRGRVLDSGTVKAIDIFVDVTLQEGDTLQAYSFTIVPMR